MQIPNMLAMICPRSNEPAGVLDPEAYQVDFNETRVSAGFALGMIEPFPVTFSFGWPLESGPADETQVFAFSLTLR